MIELLWPFKQFCLAYLFPRKANNHFKIIANSHELDFLQHLSGQATHETRNRVEITAVTANLETSLS